MSPHETFFLLPTTSIEPMRVNNNDNIQFKVLDFPGNYVLKNDSVAQIQNCGSLIYVIDAQQQDYENACVRLRDLIRTTNEIKQNIVYEVFIHKVDSDMFMTDDQKIDCLNEIQTSMRSLLQEFKTQISLSFQLTSIYDHTIYEALSKVV